MVVGRASSKFDHEENDALFLKQNTLSLNHSIPTIDKENVQLNRLYLRVNNTVSFKHHTNLIRSSHTFVTH